MSREAVKPMKFRVPFRDIDMHGEMARSAYLAHAEEAVTAFWKRRPQAENDPHFRIGKIVSTFHKVLRLDDVVNMTVKVSKIGGKSAGFTVHMVRGEDAVAETEIVLSACDLETKEPVALPEEIRDWLYQYFD